MDLNTPPAVVLAHALTRFSRRSLATQLDLDPRTIARWESGGSIARRDLLALLYLTDDRAIRPKGDFTFIDLFAGIGGMRLGFEAVGGECVFTSEWDKQSQRTYLENFPEEKEVFGDITEITKNNRFDVIPAHDLLVAGFPCQPFSIAGVSKKNALGRSHGFACEAQGTLFFDVAKILNEHKPAAFVLENVKNLESHDKKNTFRVILKTLREELGYDVHYRVIDARGFVPQHRERIFIVGFREKVPFSWDSFRLPDPSSKVMSDVLHPEDGSEVIEERFIDKRGRVLPKYTLTGHLWDYLQAYAEKHRQLGNGFGFGLVGANDVARTLSARYYKDGSEILVSRGKRKRPRRLTPRECARLMGFDSDTRKYKIVVSDTQAYRQFGNAVVVPVVAELARIVKPYVMAMKEVEDGRLRQSHLSI
jgi:DNA (cytosine-5)-methyltransferase 1